MLKGAVTTIFGDDINTDDIIPAFRLQQSNDPEFFATYAFEKFDPEFRSRCGRGGSNVVLAGKNFGCGSSREQAVYALQHNGVVCVVAGSFPDIFYRNCLANGLPLVSLPDRSGIEMGDEIEVDLAAGVIRNRTRGAAIPFAMKEEDRRTFLAGGMTARVRAHHEEILTSPARTE